MDNNREELEQLLEKENVVSKVSQLIDLEMSNYATSGDAEVSSGVLDALRAMRAELNLSNALAILEMYLNRDFEHLDASAIENTAS